MKTTPVGWDACPSTILGQAFARPCRKALSSRDLAKMYKLFSRFVGSGQPKRRPCPREHIAQGQMPTTPKFPCLPKDQEVEGERDQVCRATSRAVRRPQLHLGEVCRGAVISLYWQGTPRQARVSLVWHPATPCYRSAPTRAAERLPHARRHYRPIRYSALQNYTSIGALLPHSFDPSNSKKTCRIVPSGLRLLQDGCVFERRNLNSPTNRMANQPKEGFVGEDEPDWAQPSNSSGPRGVVGVVGFSSSVGDALS